MVKSYDPRADIEVEKKLLSALMQYEDTIPIAAESLSVDELYRPEHKIIYKAILKLGDEKAPINVLLVEQELRRTGELEKVKRKYLYSLLEYEYTGARVRAYIKIVKKCAALRRFIEIGRELIDDATNERGEPLEIMAKVERKFEGMSVDDTRKPLFLRDCLAEAYGRIVNGTDDVGLSTGFLYLDKVLSGLKKSDLIILAARPSMGKTALALNIAANVSRRNTVLIFSLEMSQAQLENRLFSAASRVKATRIQRHDLSDKEIESLAYSLNCLSDLNLIVDSTPNIGFMELKAKARRINHKHKVDLIVIDYLQLIDYEGRYAGDRVQEVSEISRGLKALARDLDVPVIALSQLSRQAEIRADKRPQLSDLRDSGAIEQDADIVMFLYREAYYDRKSENNVAELIIAENRNGSTGTVPLVFEKEYMSFKDYTVKPT